jgi:hypothetical protein
VFFYFLCLSPISLQIKRQLPKKKGTTRRGRPIIVLSVRNASQSTHHNHQLPPAVRQVIARVHWHLNWRWDSFWWWHSSHKIIEALAVQRSPAFVFSRNTVIEAQYYAYPM